MGRLVLGGVLGWWAVSGAAELENPARERLLDPVDYFSGMTNRVPAIQRPVSPFSEVDDVTESAEVRAKLKEAYELMREEKYAQAKDAFVSILRTNKHSRLAGFGLSTAYIKLEDYARSVKLLEWLLREYPSDYVLMNNLAWVLCSATDPALRDPARAVSLAREALFLAPGDLHVWSTLAEAYYHQGLYREGERAARAALLMARESGMPQDRIQEYEEQVRKCRDAAATFSVAP